MAVECHERAGRAIVVPTDVADEERCRRLIERTSAEYRRIDMLINKAGIGQGPRLDEPPT